LFQIVDKYSATLGGFRETELCVKHSLMNKFRGPSDPNFQLVAGVIRKFVENTTRRNEDPWITGEPNLLNSLVRAD
jgi:hypothetical protein